MLGLFEHILIGEARDDGCPKEALDWAKDYIHTNKRDAGTVKKMKNYKDGWGLDPKEFSKDRWGEGFFFIMATDKTDSPKVVEIPDEISRKFLEEYGKNLRINTEQIGDRHIDAIIKELPSLELIDVHGNLSLGITGKDKSLMTLDELEDKLFKEYKDYEIRGNATVVDVPGYDPRLEKLWKEVEKLKKKYKIDSFHISGKSYTRAEAEAAGVKQPDW